MYTRYEREWIHARVRTTECLNIKMKVSKDNVSEDEDDDIYMKKKVI